MDNFQQLQVYQLAEKISNEIWFIVKNIGRVYEGYDGQTNREIG